MEVHSSPNFWGSPIGHGWYKTRCIRCKELLLIRKGKKIIVHVNESGEVDGLICKTCNEKDPVI